MGLLDVPLRAAASKVVGTLGTEVTLIQRNPGTYDTTTGGGEPTDANATVKGTYFQYATKQLGDHIMLGDRGLIVAAKDVDWLPKPQDRVTDGSITYRIVNVESPQATDQAAIHILQLRGGP